MSNGTTVPSYLLLTPQSNQKILNFINFNKSGINTLNNSTAFKKIQFASKINTYDERSRRCN